MYIDMFNECSADIFRLFAERSCKQTFMHSARLAESPEQTRYTDRYLSFHGKDS